MRESSKLEKSFRLKHPLYQKHQALVEANRCLACSDAPCIKACPTNIDVPRFIKAIAEDDPYRSAKIILDSNVLGYSCARICPVEELCAGACVLHHRHEEPIAIDRLQHYACHHALTSRSLTAFLGDKAESTHKKVACVGAGAASIALATLLAHKGHHVEIFEKYDMFGGLNAWGIAPYKLYFDDAQKEIAWLKTVGTIFHECSPVENKHHADELLEKFDAIFLGFGIGNDRLDANIKSHSRIMGATDFIKRMKTDHDFSLQGIHTAHVIGGGNTALDAAHELLLLGVKNVNLVYRREKSQMSAYRHEIDGALKNGLTILENLSLSDVEFLDEKSPLRLAFGAKTFTSDLLIFAIGQEKNMSPALFFDGVKLNNAGTIEVDKTTFRTHNQKVWAAGDCVNGGKEVVNAVAEAKIAAASMHEFLIA